MKYRLHSLLMVTHGRFLRNLGRCAQEVGLFHGQPKVLEYISSHGNCTQADVCAAWDVDKSTMSGLVNRLVRDGQITCERDDNNQRRTLLDMTEKGKTSWKHMQESLGEMEKTAWNGIDEDEQRAFMRTLSRIYQNLGGEGGVEE